MDSRREKDQKKMNKNIKIGLLEAGLVNWYKAGEMKTKKFRTMNKQNNLIYVDFSFQKSMLDEWLLGHSLCRIKKN